MRTALLAMILFCSLTPITTAGQMSSGNLHRGQSHEIHKLEASSTAVPPALPVAELSSASPPLVVVYRDGLLGITAQNAPLGDVLDQVHESTGATVEFPAVEERISVHIRPRPPAQVVAELLKGLHLNYAILGGTNDRNHIERIIVTLEPPQSLQLGAAPQIRVLEDAAAKARAQAQIQFVEETGGDEGVWENRAQSPPQEREPSSPTASTPPSPQ
jgi:hypothetical protein